MTSGGGSAALLSTYIVSPLEAIQEAAKSIGAEVDYTIGAHTHKYLPLLDPYIEKEGALVEFWNQSPSEKFLDPHSGNLGAELPRSAWSTRTNGTNLFLADGVDDRKVDEVCWLRVSPILSSLATILILTRARTVYDQIRTR